MRKKAAWIACLALLLVPWIASAETIADVRLAKADPCGPFEVVHINGVLTDFAGAQANLFRLAAVYGNGHNGHIITYRLAHNQTQGPIDDLIEMWVLKMKEQPSLTFTVFTSIWKGLTTGTSAQASLINAIRAKLGTYDLLPVLISDPAVALIAAQIRAPLQVPKYKTVLVGHSQGTSYAIKVMERLIAGTGLAHKVPAGSISMVSLGAAANRVMGPSASHATSHNDFVIGALRTYSIPVGFAVLGPNITIPLLPGDWLGHNLQRVYMAHSVGQDAFKSRLKAALNAVKSPAPPTPPAIIQIKSWGMVCGTYSDYTKPGCWLDVPTGTSPPQYHENVSLNLYNVFHSPIQVHTQGTHSGLAAPNLARLMGCYSWWINDRIAVIKSLPLGYMPTSGFHYPYHLHSGSCGAGFPWMTPYGNPDAAYLIYSADSYKINVLNYTLPNAYGVHNSYYTTHEMTPVCNRAT